MTYYCPYCNRQRDKSDSPKTREHFIPQSVGGSWAIAVCGQCNHGCGQTMDALFADMAWDYGMLARGKIGTAAKAIVRNGPPVRGRLYMDAYGGGEQMFRPDYGATINESDIETVDIEMSGDTSWIQRFGPKVALGATWYLLKRFDAPASCIWNFKRKPFSLMRAEVVSQHLESIVTGDKWPAPGGIAILMMGPARAHALQSSFKQPDVRRHFVSIADEPPGFTVTCSLYSEYYFSVRLLNFYLGLEGLRLSDECILGSLPRLAARRGTSQHLKGKIHVIWNSKRSSSHG